MKMARAGIETRKARSDGPEITAKAWQVVLAGGMSGDELNTSQPPRPLANAMGRKNAAPVMVCSKTAAGTILVQVL